MSATAPARIDGGRIAVAPEAVAPEAVAAPVEEAFPYLWPVVAGLTLMTWAKGFMRLMSIPTDSDLFTHLATGRFILSHGIPASDVLSWTGKELGFPSTYHEWLYDIGIYRLWLSAGYAGVFVLTAMFVAVAGLLVYALTRLRSGRPIVGIITAAGAVTVLIMFAAPRPQVVTYCLLLSCAILLERGRWWAVLPIYVLAINLHGATYAIYLFVIAYYLLPKKPLPFLAIAATTVLNPIGPALFVYPFKTLLSVSNVPIMEMQRVTPFTTPLHYLVLAVAALAMLRRGIPWRDRLYVAVLGLFSLTAVRQMVWFYILALPVAVPYLLRPVSQVHVAEGRSRVLTLKRANGVLAALLVLTAVTTAISASRKELRPEADYPSASAAYMRDHGLGRVFNHWNQGGYLLFVGPPPLIDGRYEPFAPVYNGGRDFVGEYLGVLYARKDGRPFFDKYGVETLLLPKDCPLYRAVRGRAGFTVAFEEKAFAVLTYDAAVAKAAAR